MSELYVRISMSMTLGDHLSQLSTLPIECSMCLIAVKVWKIERFVLISTARFKNGTFHSGGAFSGKSAGFSKVEEIDLTQAKRSIKERQV